MPPEGGLLCGLDVADLCADPWLLYTLTTSLVVMGRKYREYK